jgi:hypothetical protein
MTVTATAAGAASNRHIYLQVDVATGAAEAGGAALAGIGASGGASAGGSLTPNFSSSLVCFALSADNPGTASFTALSGNSVTPTGLDSDDWLYGAGHFTGTVTAGTPVAFGGSCTSSDYTTWAGYEVPSSGGTTPVLDGSAPVLATATTKTVTSASFTPPAGAVLVAKIVIGCSGTSGSCTMTVTGGSLTWTQRAGNPVVADQDTFIFTATVPGGGGAVPAASPVLARAPGLLSPQAWTEPRIIERPVSTQFPPQAQPSFPALAPFQAPGLHSPSAWNKPAVPFGDATLITAPLTITGLGGVPGTGYFRDRNGTPRMVLGDAVWGLPGNAGRWNSGNWQADYDGYFATRGAQGFTAAYTKPMGTTQNGGINDDGRTFDGLVPFQGGSLGNPSSGLTAAYWARIDYMLASAAAQGITVFLNAIGYDSDFESSGPLAGKSATEFQAYGTAVGTRYAATPNLVWVVADDYFGTADTQITAFLTGLRGAGASQPITIENYPETTSRQDLPAATATAWGAANAQYNWCYSYNVTYFGVEKAYLESSPVPVIQGDGYFYQGSSSYEGGSGAFAFDRAIRQDAWHAISSGARGIIHGDEACWQWQSTAQASAAVAWYYARNAGKIRALMESLPGWHLLLPDTSSALVTAGRGTHASGFSSGGGGGQYEVAFTDSYVTASRVPDGSLAVIYLSHATTITIDQAQMGAGYTAAWADPVTGVLTPATAGSSYNSATPGSNSQGDPDWVLVLRAVPSSTGTGTAAAAKPGASGSGTVGTGSATGTGTAAAARPGASGAGWATVTGTGTAAGHRPSASASGAAEDYAGTAAAAARKAGASGTGWATDHGTGTAAAAKPGASAAGYMVPSGTGTAAAHRPSAAGSGATAEFVGSGTAAAARPSASGSGRVEAEGSGTAAARKPGASAGGSFAPLAAAGTGTAAARKPSASASGQAEARGTGTASARKPAASASGTFTPLAVTGTGTAVARKPSAGAAGHFGLEVTGTGAAAARKPGAGGSAGFAIAVTGTGTAAARKPSALARAWWRPAGGTLSYQGSPPFTVARGVVGGVVTLNGTTTVTVAAPGVSASSLILLTVQPGHAPAGWPRVDSITPGTGFTVKSGSGSDTAVVCGWYVVQAA